MRKIMIDNESEMFRDWLDDMSVGLARFQDFQAPEGMTADYSPASLGQLETYLLSRWPDRQAFGAEADLDFTDGAVRYIGETFLRAAGGGWHFSYARGFAFAGRPFIQLDTMDRTPISPYNLITALLTRRTSAELTRVFGFQQENIAERRAEEGDGWQPHRDPLPGVHKGSHPPAGSNPHRDAGRQERRIWPLDCEG